jgi:hypothetical protein
MAAYCNSVAPSARLEREQFFAFSCRRPLFPGSYSNEKSPQATIACGLFCFQEMSRVGLLYFVLGQMSVRFCELSQFRFIIDVWIRHLEAAHKIGRVGLDIFDTVNFFQIAPDRGGTTPSDHVRYFERDQCEL